MSEMTDPTEAIKTEAKTWADALSASHAHGRPITGGSALAAAKAIRALLDRLDSAERAMANVASYWVTRGINPIKVECARQMEGPDKWAIRQGGNCLNKSGEWEWEPMPSGRDDDFLVRCRFESAQAAMEAALRVSAVGGEG